MITNQPALYFRAMVDKLNALKAALTPEQLAVYNDSLSEAKANVLGLLRESDKVLHELADELYR